MMYMTFDDDQDALELVLDTESGRFVREDGRWFTFPASNSRLDGAEIIEVDQDFLEFYDKLNSKGNEPTYKQTKSYRIEAEEE